MEDSAIDVSEDVQPLLQTPSPQTSLKKKIRMRKRIPKKKTDELKGEVTTKRKDNDPIVKEVKFTDGLQILKPIEKQQPAKKGDKLRALRQAFVRSYNAPLKFEATYDPEPEPSESDAIPSENNPFQSNIPKINTKIPNFNISDLFEITISENNEGKKIPVAILDARFSQKKSDAACSNSCGKQYVDNLIDERLLRILDRPLDNFERLQQPGTQPVDAETHDNLRKHLESNPFKSKDDCNANNEEIGVGAEQKPTDMEDAAKKKHLDYLESRETTSTKVETDTSSPRETVDTIISDVSPDNKISSHTHMLKLDDNFVDETDAAPIDTYENGKVSIQKKTKKSKTKDIVKYDENDKHNDIKQNAVDVKRLKKLVAKPKRKKSSTISTSSKESQRLEEKTKELENLLSQVKNVIPFLPIQENLPTDIVKDFAIQPILDGFLLHTRLVVEDGNCMMKMPSGRILLSASWNNGYYVISSENENIGILKSGDSINHFIAISYDKKKKLKPLAQALQKMCHHEEIDLNVKHPRELQASIEFEEIDQEVPAIAITVPDVEQNTSLIQKGNLDLLSMMKRKYNQTNKNEVDRFVTTYRNKKCRFNPQTKIFEMPALVALEKLETIPSIKNLIMMRTDRDASYLQLAKESESSYHLHFKYPISPFQALTIAVASTHHAGM